MALIYTGGMFGGSVAGVPARDLSDAEVEQHGGETLLLATGLYVKSGASKKSAASETPAKKKEGDK